jgi:hypothetical protein
MTWVSWWQQCGGSAAVVIVERVEAVETAKAVGTAKTAEAVVAGTVLQTPQCVDQQRRIQTRRRTAKFANHATPRRAPRHSATLMRTIRAWRGERRGKKYRASAAQRGDTTGGRASETARVSRLPRAHVTGGRRRGCSTQP